MDGYVAFGRALAAERNAREWQNYARNLETQIRQLKAKLSSTAQDHQLSREVSRRTAELYREEQALAAALDALQNKLAIELAKFSPNNPLVPRHFRAMIVEKATKAGLAPQQVRELGLSGRGWMNWSHVDTPKSTLPELAPGAYAGFMPLQRDQTMPADKLGRYITSDLFFKRANEAIAKAARGLEARGIQPCYLDRKTGLIVGRDRTYRIQLRDPAVQAVVLELFADGKHGELMDRLVAFAATDLGAHQVNYATRAVTGLLLLAKTAMPREAAHFFQTVREQMAGARPYPELVELAELLIEANARSDDVPRDPTIIDDALFSQRIEAITQALRQ